MSTTITDTTMTSDQTGHAARHAPDRNGWEVSWLPGQTLDRNTAITAMVLAETAAEPDLHDGHHLWPDIQGWAQELSLTAPDAIARASQPPTGLNRQHEPPSRQPDREAADSPPRHGITTSRTHRTAKPQLTQFLEKHRVTDVSDQ